MNDAQINGAVLGFVPEEVISSAAEVELSCFWRQIDNGRDLWISALEQLAYIPCAYSSAVLDYQQEYVASFHPLVFDLSLILLHDRQSVGVWPLTLTRRVEGKWSLGSNEGGLLPPLLQKNLPKSAEKRLLNQCLRFIACLRDQFEPMLPWQSVEFFCDRVGFSPWHLELMHKAESVQLHHELFVDLSLGFSDIKARFRRRYRSLITAGERFWQVSVLRDNDTEVWREFRCLHRDVAGRDTRSEASWQWQLEAIAKGAAFLVCLRNDVGALVGGGFFHVTRDEGLYAVGAYNRSLFDKPLGHVVQAQAIREMQARGVSWYRLGIRSYPGDRPAPTAKELSIAEFKEGFSTHTMPRLSVVLPMSFQPSVGVETA